MSTGTHIDRGIDWENSYIKDKDVVAREIAGEMLLVPIRGELADMQRIFALNPLGGFIWDRLDGRVSLLNILEAVLEEFDVQVDQAQQDIEEFVGGLLSEGLASRVPV